MKAIIIPKGTIINCDKIKIPTIIDKLVIDKDIILKVTYNNEYDEFFLEGQDEGFLTILKSKLVIK